MKSITMKKTSLTTCVAAVVLTIALTLLVGVIGITPVYAQNISGTGDFIVTAGAPAFITGDVTGTIYVESDAVLNMTGNHTITGTVFVRGTFNMSAGTITGPGRGVDIHTNGRFYMSGGLIYIDTLGAGSPEGLAVRANTLGSVFTMTGGRITANSAIVSIPNAVQADITGTFIMRGGIIENINSQFGAVHVRGDNARFYMYGGTIYNNHNVRSIGGAGGGGVRVVNGGTMIMHGGTISHNSSVDYGGGVGVVFNPSHPSYSLGSRLLMHGGTIENNTARLGAGVFVQSGAVLETSNTATIANNTASHYGGGVYLSGISMVMGELRQSRFDMSGGRIYGNRAISGAGVMVVDRAAFNPTGGIIESNVASSFGGGIAAADPDTTIDLGNIIINNNSASAGGGIWVGAGVSLSAANSTITNNTATTNGGGIWTHLYDNLRIAASVTFFGNTAASAHNHGVANRGEPGDVPGGLPAYVGASAAGQGASGGNPENIHWRMVSIPGTHALNNWDINYFGAPFTPPPPVLFPIYKELLLPDVAEDLDGNFTFNIQLVDETFHNITPLPIINIPLAIPLADMTPQASNPNMLEGYVNIEFGSIEWPGPGRYIFRVTEVEGSSGITDMIYDPSVFYIHVYVGWVDNTFSQLIVLGSDTTPPTPRIFAWPGNPDAPGSPGVPGSAEGKTYIEFFNTLIPPLNTTGLEVEKRVTGVSANPNIPFNFEVVLDMTEIPEQHIPEYITAVVTGYGRNTDTEVVILTREHVRTITIPVVNGIATTAGITPPLTLRHADIITFPDVPIGTVFEVTEENDDEHEQSGRVVAGGVQTMSETAGNGEDLFVYGIVAALAETGRANTRGVFNYVVVTNDYDYTPPTGIFLSNVPFGLMVALGAGAMVTVGAVAVLHSKAKRKR